MKQLIYENTEIINLPNEKWIECYEYGDYYEVSNLGRIKSLERNVVLPSGKSYLKKEKIIKQSIYKGNLKVGFSLNGKRNNFLVSRLVYFSFNKKINADYKILIIHKNSNNLDNTLKNLKTSSRSEVTTKLFKDGKLDVLKKNLVNYVGVVI